MIILKSVSKSFGWLTRRKQVLSSVSGVFRADRHYVIVGAPKSGKTSLLRLLCGLQSPTRGKIERRGRVSLPIGSGNEFARKHTLRELTTLFARRFGADPRDVARFTFDTTGLERFANYPAVELPGDQRRRFYFALGYAVPADIYLLDETLVCGDHEFREICAKSLAARRKSCGTIFATSDTGRAENYGGDAGAVLHEGLLTFYESAGAAIEAFRELRLAELHGSLEYVDELMALGRREEVVPYLRELLAHDPRNTAAYTALAQAAFDLDDLTLARQAAESAVSLSSEASDLHYMIGSIAEKQGDTVGAIRNLARFVESQPTNSKALSALARLYEKQGAFRDAAIVWRALSKVGNSLALRFAMRASMKVGDWELALSDVDGLLEQNPDPKFYESKANILFEMGDQQGLIGLVRSLVRDEEDTALSIIRRARGRVDDEALLTMLRFFPETRLDRLTGTPLFPPILIYLQRQAKIARRNQNTPLLQNLEAFLSLAEKYAPIAAPEPEEPDNKA